MLRPLIFLAHGLGIAVATEWFGSAPPCITLFTFTFHWMTLLILILVCCCCCSPCAILGAAYSMQRRPNKVSASTVKPTATYDKLSQEEAAPFMRGFEDVFPHELRRAAVPTAKKREMPKCNWAACGATFCFVLLMACALLLPLLSWTSFRLFNGVMMDLSFASPKWMWVILLILSTLSGCIGLPALWTRRFDNKAKFLLYSLCSLGGVMLVITMWGFTADPSGAPYLARAGNEICRDFAKARPSVCGAAPTPAPAVRRLFGNSSKGEALADIDLDEDGLEGAVHGLLRTTHRRLDAAHDGAKSYIQRLLTGGSYCVDTSKNAAAWVAPSYDERAHNAAVSYKKSITTAAVCEDTDLMCKNGPPADTFNQESCSCNGLYISVTHSSKIVKQGGHCNLWNFGDATPWCYVNVGVKNCGTVTTLTTGPDLGYSRSSGPCEDEVFSYLVVNKSQALEKGLNQYLNVLVCTLCLALLSFFMASAAYYANRTPQEKRYHEDNNLPWSELGAARRKNEQMWTVLGWDKVRWEADDPNLYPPSENKSWAQLSKQPRNGAQASEAEAAAALGFTEDTWDGSAQQDARTLAANGSSGQESQQDELVEAQVADQFYAWQEEASRRITAETPETKRLEVYGLYHQSSQGDVSGLRPSGATGLDEQKKYDAWFKLRGMSRAQAMQKYISAVKELQPKK